MMTISILPRSFPGGAAEYICNLYLKEIETLGIEQVQILSPFRSRGDASTDRLNEKIREAVNPPAPNKPEITRGGMTLRLNDKVMQKKNDSSILLRDRKGNLVSHGVFNGEVGKIQAVQKEPLSSILMADMPNTLWRIWTSWSWHTPPLSTKQWAVSTIPLFFPCSWPTRSCWTAMFFTPQSPAQRNAFGWWGRKKHCSWPSAIREPAAGTLF